MAITRTSGKITLFIAILFCSRMLYAQYKPEDFQRYTISDGLSNNHITGIQQDQRGYIWISTIAGLNRYDGSRFVQFRAGNGSTAMQDDYISDMSWLQPGKLALSTNMGLHIIDTRTGRPTTILVPSLVPGFDYKFNTVSIAKGDEQGNIYITTGSGFYHYNNRQQLVYRFDNIEKEKTATAILSTGNNIVWIGKNELAVTVDNEKYIYHTGTKQLVKTDQTHRIYADPFSQPELYNSDTNGFFMFQLMTDTVLYFNSIQKTKTVSVASIKPLRKEFDWHAGLFRVNDTLFYITARLNGFFKMTLQPQTGKLTIHPEKYFSNYFCTGFLKDRDGRVWIATNAGLFKQNIVHHAVKQAAIPDTLLQQTPEADIKQLFVFNNLLYAVCANNGGLLVYDKDSLKFIKKISLKKHQPHADDIRSVVHVVNDTFFVATYGPLYWLHISNGESGEVQLENWNRYGDRVLAHLKDRDGNIWHTTNKNKIYYYKTAERKFYLYDYKNTEFEKLLMPHYAALDKSGNPWFAGHGLCRINLSTGKPDLYIDSFPATGIFSKETSGLAIDQNNTVWFGNTGNGLIGYRSSNKNYRHYTKLDGLAGNNVNAIQLVNHYIWVGTTEGISCVNLRKNSVSSFGADDGFPVLPFTSASFYYDSSGRYLYAGFTNRIVKFHADSLLRTAAAPNFFIESVSFANDTSFYLPPSSITTGYRNNDFKITIGSISYLQHQQNEHLAYRIAGSKDTSWKAITGNVIHFNNLAPGTYAIQLKLSAANNRWPAQFITFTITVTPPFWKTPWFIALMTLAFSLTVFGIYKWRVQTVRKTEQEKSKTQELRAEKYKTQFELEQITNFFSSSLADKKNTDDVLWDVARNLMGKLDYEDCMIYLWNRNKTKMIQRAGYGIKNSPDKLAMHVFEAKPGQGVVGYVMETKEPVIIADTRNDKRYRVDDVFRLSEICVPIIHDGELLGIIDSEHHQPDYFKERDLKILTTIATLTANKIKQMESDKILEVKEKELVTINQQLAEAQLAALQAQMNPHFIFNALNSIKRMILDDEKEKASRYLSKFAQLIRLTLNHSREPFVTLKENVEYLSAYLEMEQLRFKDSFTGSVEVDATIDDEETGIPSLMIQPLIENAVWHGLLHKEGEKKVAVRFSKNHDHMICSIEDNGIGILQSEANKKLRQQGHKSVGLDNLRNRIQIMNEKFDMDCSLTITDLKETGENRNGTLAVLKFKIRDLI